MVPAGKVASSIIKSPQSSQVGPEQRLAASEDGRTGSGQGPQGYWQGGGHCQCQQVRTYEGEGIGLKGTMVLGYRGRQEQHGVP